MVVRVNGEDVNPSLVVIMLKWKTKEGSLHTVNWLESKAKMAF